MSQSAKTIRRLGLSVLVSMLPVAVALADSPPVPRTYGTSSEIILQIPAAGFLGFQDRGSRYEADEDDYYVYNKSTVNADFVFLPVNLPHGALITGFVLYYNIRYAGYGNVTATLVELRGGNGVSQPTVNATRTAISSSDAGYGVVGLPLSSPITVSNSYQYLVKVLLGTATGFKAVDIRYHLQLGPAPAKATFADVRPDNLYFRAVEALAGSGITSGCGNGNFCPNKNVTRGELAKFLAVALGLNWPE
jgi:hypothetical protein